MKVHELITKLQAMPQDWEALIDGKAIATVREEHVSRGPQTSIPADPPARRDPNGVNLRS